MPEIGAAYRKCQTPMGRLVYDGHAPAGLADYHRHHCGYVVSIGFPPSSTGGSKVVGMAPGSDMELKVGMTFHAHSWFTNTTVVDCFISNTMLLGEKGAEVLTCATPQTPIVR